MQKILRQLPQVQIPALLEQVLPNKPFSADQEKCRVTKVHAGKEADSDTETPEAR